MPKIRMTDTSAATSEANVTAISNAAAPAAAGRSPHLVTEPAHRSEQGVPGHAVDVSQNRGGTVGVDRGEQFIDPRIRQRLKHFGAKRHIDGLDESLTSRRRAC
jgi:hypothetical protein